MYLVVIMAFAFVLSDDLPPEQLNLLGGLPWTGPVPLYGTLAAVLGQLIVIAAVALIASRMTLARLGACAESHDRATSTFSDWQRLIIGIIAAMLIGTMILTPWMPLVRECIHLGGKPLGEWPLLANLLALAPFFGSLALVWAIFYPVEMRIRAALAVLPRTDAEAATRRTSNEAIATLAAAKRKLASLDGSLGTYLADKFRHQVLIIAVPMMIIVLAKHFTDKYHRALMDATSLPWAADALLGTLSVVILAFAPVILRFIWATEPLPAGALRERFVRTCARIGLRYREILLWHTHGTAINAAVMGFIAPLRYILVSDALLETMDEEEIEAVFGHEAGHVRHWHLPFFGLFAVVSMYISGGVIILLSSIRFLSSQRQAGLLQLIGLAVLLLVWLFGFGWLSRRFERQADVYGVRCVTPDIKSCSDRCPVHGKNTMAGLCVSAASLFGRTLLKIADLNGIPRDAPSWRHGTIESRCRLIEDLAADQNKLKRFDRKILWIKIGLVAASIIGSVVAGLIYGQQLLHAVDRWRGA
jgi:STE24 endopeptidase